MPKSKHQIPGRVRSAYECIKANRDRSNVQTMCRVLEVGPSGYDDWQQQPMSNRAQQDARLLRLIRQVSSSRVTASTAHFASTSICGRPADL